jgi:uncharacterized membrane protein
MKVNPVVISTAISGLFALSALAAPALAAEKAPNEKCYGVTKAGKNDCQTASSACAGTSKKDGDPSAWIYVPKGTCDKIVGGSLTAKK